MQRKIRVYAPAKINIGLKVLPKREDGFHNIESIFQTLDVKDILDVEETEGFGRCSVHCSSINLPEKNTLNTAYNAFCDAAGFPVRSVNVELTKRIPCGGGLGGGSSDAAALVRALEDLNGINLSIEQLDEIAGKVGSDVFFFLHCGKDIQGAAVVTGRGEYINEISKRADLYFVLVFPEVSSSTKEAYALIDELYQCENQVAYPELDELEKNYNDPVEKWRFVNTFTPALISRYGEIEHSLKCIKETDALFADMSGSGSTVFGVYVLREKALNALELLKAQGFNAVLSS